MKEYTPDRWIIVNMDGNICKVLGSWYGGYLGADSWRFSSGITKLEEDGDYYLFHNYSGSIYKCHKEAKGTNNIAAITLNSYQDQAKEMGKEITVIKDIKDLYLYKE